MSRYDTWGKLVGAVNDKEKLKQLALADSLSSTSSDKSSSDSSGEDVPVDDVPIQDVPADKSSSDSSDEDVPVQDVPADKNSSDSSDEDVPVQDVPVQDAPAVKDEKTLPTAYDNWDRLINVVLRREELRQLVFMESSSSVSSDFSFDSCSEDMAAANIFADSPGSNVSIGPAASSIRSDLSLHDVRPIKYKEIKEATKNFDPDLLFDQGEFGQYFKGWVDKHTLTASFPGAGMLVAVKKCLQERLQEHQEFLDEVNYLNQLHHPNLVKLIGYCSEEGVMILVYEFMLKGRLEHHLFTRGHQSLSWETRIKVALGAARALSFLHEKEILAFRGSFTSDAILLDEEFNAKLSDFCLTREDLFPQMASVPPRVDEYGYAAPEYLATGELTTKYDVFGFGVLLLELLSGLQSCINHTSRGEQTLVEWAKPYLGRKGKVLRIVDSRLTGQYPRKEAYKVAELCFKCLSLDPKLRPRMSEVVTELQQLRIHGQSKGAYKIVKLAFKWLSPR